MSANQYQARVWLSEQVGHLNLGCYGNMSDAWEAVRAYLNRGELPDHLLPRWVRRVGEDGAGGFTAWCSQRGRKLRVGTFATADAAHEAMRELIRQTFPDGLATRSRSRAATEQRERDRLANAKREKKKASQREAQRALRLSRRVAAVRAVIEAEPGLADLASIRDRVLATSGWRLECALVAAAVAQIRGETPPPLEPRGHRRRAARATALAAAIGPRLGEAPSRKIDAVRRWLPAIGLAASRAEVARALRLLRSGGAVPLPTADVVPVPVENLATPAQPASPREADGDAVPQLAGGSVA